MKTRIFSAVVALALFAAVITLKDTVPFLLYIVISFICADTVWELIYNTKMVKSKAITVICMIYGAFTPFVYAGIISFLTVTHLNLLLAVVLLVVALARHIKITPIEVACGFSFTVFVTYAFSTLMMLIRKPDGYGIVYLLIACAFAWGCDTGAYFTGVFFGKHKLAPVISPKKTVEGAVGGIIICVIITVVLGFIFNNTLIGANETINLVKLGIITPVFAVLGMIGDLLASYIKRSVGIKDYGKIMPGHGGVLDRFDSLLLIAPVFYLTLEILPIIERI